MILITCTRRSNVIYCALTKTTLKSKTKSTKLTLTRRTERLPNTLRQTDCTVEETKAWQRSQLWASPHFRPICRRHARWRRSTRLKLFYWATGESGRAWTSCADALNWKPCEINSLLSLVMT